MGAAGAVIGGVSSIFGLAGQSSSAASQKAAMADQQAMLAKQAFYNALALNAAQTNLAYEFDTADLQQRATDLQATQQNFQQLMGAREQYLATNGQIDQQRFQAQQQYFGTLFGQGQQSTNTVFQSSQNQNNRLFQVGIAGMQEGAALTKQGQDNMFGSAVNAMNREQQVSSQGISNMLQTGIQGITNTRDTFLSGAENVFNTSNQISDAYTTADVALSNSQSQGFQETNQVAGQLEAQARDIQRNQEVLQQQDSALQAVYSAMVGGNYRNTFSGVNAQERMRQEATNTQQQFEQTANKAIGQTNRNAQYRNDMASLNLSQIGELGSLGIDNAINVANLNNENVGYLSLLSDLNALGNYGRDTTLARNLGSLDEYKAATDFNRDYGLFAQQNQMGIDYTNFNNQVESGFLRDFLNAQDRYVSNNAMSQLQQTNAGLNQNALTALQQKQLAEMGYLQGNYQIATTSQGNRLANLMAMQTGMNNASLQSDANSTLNQAQQAALRMQAAGIQGPNIGNYLQAGLGVYQGIQPLIGGNNRSAFGGGINPYTPQNNVNYGYTPYNFYSNSTLPSGGFFSSGSYGTPTSYGTNPGLLSSF